MQYSPGEYRAFNVAANSASRLIFSNKYALADFPVWVIGNLVHT